MSHVAPYPGLRPFDISDEELFYGRGAHIVELLDVLERDHFLAVVGASGCGKSSLVRAGLLPQLLMGALDTDYPSESPPRWRFAICQPGRTPIPHLARELGEMGIGSAAFCEAALRSSAGGLLDLAHVIGNRDPSVRLLLLVDQFEELFSPVDGPDEWERRNEALAFVDLLLTSVRKRSPNLYVCLTMRSDFLGACEQFPDLPQAVSRSQFLVPRLNRRELRMAIERPVGHPQFQGEIAPEVVARILVALNDAVSDQLPLVQHALMRMWHTAAADDRSSITRDDYRAIGGVRAALDRHLEEIYRSLNGEQRAIARRAFCGLCVRGADGQTTRNLITISELAALAGCSEPALVAVLRVFTGQGRNFIRGLLADAEPLGETTIDLAHESIPRQWRRLRKWLDDDLANAQQYAELVRRATNHAREEGELLIGRDLAAAEKWWEEAGPTREWAERLYGSSYARTQSYLERSARREKSSERRGKTILAGLVVFLFVASTLALTVWALGERDEAHREAQRADKNRKSAVEARSVALKEKARAEEERQRADDERKNARRAEEEAKQDRAKAVRAAELARAARDEATRARDSSRAEAAKAERAKLRAERAEELAEKRRREAESSAKDAKAKAEEASRSALAAEQAASLAKARLTLAEALRAKSERSWGAAALLATRSLVRSNSTLAFSMLFDRRLRGDQGLQYTIALESPITVMAFGPRNLLALGTSDGEVVVCELSDNKAVQIRVRFLVVRNKPVARLAFDRLGTQVIATADRVVAVARITRIAKAMHHIHSNRVISADFVTADSRLLTVTEKEVRYWSGDLTKSRRTRAKGDWLFTGAIVDHRGRSCVVASSRRGAGPEDASKHLLAVFDLRGGNFKATKHRVEGLRDVRHFRAGKESLDDYLVAASANSVDVYRFSPTRKLEQVGGQSVRGTIRDWGLARDGTGLAITTLEQVQLSKIQRIDEDSFSFDSATAESDLLASARLATMGSHGLVLWLTDGSLFFVSGSSYLRLDSAIKGYDRIEDVHVDSGRAAILHADGVVRLWRVGAGPAPASTSVSERRGPHGNIIGASLGPARRLAGTETPTGELLLTGTREGSIRLWARNGVDLVFWRQWYAQAPLELIALSPEGPYVATASSNRLELWNITRKGVHRVQLEAQPLALAYDRTRIYCFDRSGKLQGFDNKSHRLEIEFRLAQNVRKACYSADASTLLLWREEKGKDGRLERFSVVTGKLLSSCVAPGPPTALALRGSEALVGDAHGRVRAYDMSHLTGKATDAFRAHEEAVRAIITSAQRILSATRTSAKIWSVDDRRRPRSILEGGDWSVACFGRRGTRLATASEEILRIWETKTFDTDPVEEAWDVRLAYGLVVAGEQLIAVEPVLQLPAAVRASVRLPRPPSLPKFGKASRLSRSMVETLARHVVSSNDAALNCLSVHHALGNMPRRPNCYRLILLESIESKAREGKIDGKRLSRLRLATNLLRKAYQIQCGDIVARRSLEAMTKKHHSDALAEAISKWLKTLD